MVIAIIGRIRPKTRPKSKDFNRLLLTFLKRLFLSTIKLKKSVNAIITNKTSASLISVPKGRLEVLIIGKKDIKTAEQIAPLLLCAEFGAWLKP